VVSISDAAHQEAFTPVKTEIVAVTVYPDQARITRQGQVEVLPSTVALAIAPLPAVLQPQSIQAYVQGTAQVVLQKPDLQELPLTVPSQLDKEALTQQLHQVDKAFRDCKDTLSGLRHQQAFLEALSTQSASSLAQRLAQASTGIQEVAQFLEFFEQTYQRLARAIAAQEHLKQALDHQLQQARQALQQQATASAQPNYRVVLPIQVETPGSLEIRLVYDVAQAQWTPVYDVRVDTNHPLLRVDCLAEIQQNTSEPWSNADIQVSTATPAQPAAIPHTSPLSIQPQMKKRAPEREQRPERDIKSRSRVLEDTYRMLGALPGSELTTSMVEAASLGNPNVHPASAIIGFSATTSVEIPSDGQPHRILVGQRHLQGQFTYLALPQHHRAPYLCAKLINPPEKGPLLSGPVHLFRASGYVGEVSLNYVAPGEPFQLSLGLDERVTIQRELIAKETRGEGQCIELRTYRLLICNPFSYPIEITVLEQIPISCTEDITVNLVTADPPATVSQEGQCEWAMQLDAQETAHLYYQYAVEHPAAVPIAGLDG
jgi:uncharacterized protein (TIGR02231 family)